MSDGQIFVVFVGTLKPDGAFELADGGIKRAVAGSGLRAAKAESC